jgi:hypothetical protein
MQGKSIDQDANKITVFKRFGKFYKHSKIRQIVLRSQSAIKQVPNLFAC